MSLPHNPDIFAGFSERFWSFAIFIVTGSKSFKYVAQQSALTSAQAAQQSVSGVNLDEEAANLLRFEQAYQAAAQVIKVADSLFQTLMSSVGRA